MSTHPISGLLLGNGSSILHSRVAKKLASSTRDRSARSGIEAETYTPWLCTEVRIGNRIQQYPELFGDYWSSLKGGLASEPNQLATLDHFLRGPGAFVLQPLTSQPGLANLRVFHEIDQEFPLAKAATEQMLDLLSRCAPDAFSIYKALVSCIVPLNREVITGLSSHYARGAVFLSYSPKIDPFDLAIYFIHEVAHQAIINLESFDPLISETRKKSAYSAARRQARPVRQCIQSAGAITYMLSFARNCPSEAAPANVAERIDELSRHLHYNLNTLEASCSFTPVGRILMDEMLSSI